MADQQGQQHHQGGAPPVNPQQQQQYSSQNQGYSQYPPQNYGQPGQYQQGPPQGQPQGGYGQPPQGWQQGPPAGQQSYGGPQQGQYGQGPPGGQQGQWQQQQPQLNWQQGPGQQDQHQQQPSNQQSGQPGGQSGGPPGEPPGGTQGDQSQQGQQQWGQHPPQGGQQWGQGPPSQQQWGQSPPQQQQWGQGPPYQQQWNQGYPQQQWGQWQPPPQQQQQLGFGPPQQWGQGQPPQWQQSLGQPPQQMQHGAQAQPSPPGSTGAFQFSAPRPPIPPADIVSSFPPLNPVNTAKDLRKAMKGFGTNEEALSRALARFPADQLDLLREQYAIQHERSLEKDIKSELKGHFEDAILCILRGPRKSQIFTVKKALQGLGTDTCLLNNILIGRTNADMKWLKEAYKAEFGKTLEQDVKDDLSGKTERLFTMILQGNRNENETTVIQADVDRDVVDLHRATEAKAGTDELVVCSIFSQRSGLHLRAVAAKYKERFAITLEKVILEEFSGHMEDALVAMLRNALYEPATYQAFLIGAAVQSANSDAIVERIVAAHWDRRFMWQVKWAYKALYSRRLENRIDCKIQSDEKDTGNAPVVGNDARRLILAMIS